MLLQTSNCEFRGSLISVTHKTILGSLVQGGALAISGFAIFGDGHMGNGANP